VFNITRGTRQGSILSPIIFNVFIDDLLKELAAADSGIRIGRFKCNSFAYADDITLLCSSVTGLQTLINICTVYAAKWRFNFNINKTKCMTSGIKILGDTKMYLNRQHLENVDCLEILGCQFNSDGKIKSHVNKRVQCCRRSFFNLSEAGMSYPGLDSQTKAHLWKAVCAPSLLYGFECMNASELDVQKLESTQGSLIKQALGLCKRSHHSNVLSALSIPKVRDVLMKQTLSLYHRIFTTDTPARDLCCELLNMYIHGGHVIRGTLVWRIKNLGMSPVLNAFIKPSVPNVSVYNTADGVVSSLRYLLCHENYMKPYSAEHLLSQLLTRAF